jgi:hypothetical protein
MEYVKFGSQLPEAIYERFAALGHGEKRTACAAGLLWYFSIDPETARLYREWARAIADGLATMERPPETVAAALAQRRTDTKSRKGAR